MSEWTQGYFTAAVESAETTSYSLLDISEIFVTEKIQEKVMSLVQNHSGTGFIVYHSYRLRLKEITKPIAFTKFANHGSEYWLGYFEALKELNQEDVTAAQSYWFEKYKTAILTSLKGMQNNTSQKSHSRNISEASKIEFANQSKIFAAVYDDFAKITLKDIL